MRYVVAKERSPTDVVLQMPTYQYRAYGLNGEFAQGDIEAANAGLAGDLLWARGLTPFELHTTQSQSDQRWWQRELFSDKGGQSGKDVAAFTRELATLCEADVPLDDALRIVHDQASSPRVRSLVAGLRTEVLNGTMLSDAMKKKPEAFPVDFVNMVRAGEIGGTLGTVLLELAELLERRIEVRARIQSALIYPCMLVVLSIVTLVIIVGVLIPSIAPIFAETGRSAPIAVRFLLAVHAHWAEVLAVTSAAALAALGIGKFALRRPDVRVGFDRRKLKLPVLGTFLLEVETARFTRTLGTMLKAGVPIIQAVASARDVVGNRQVTADLDRALEVVQQGTALHRALCETSLPGIAQQMIAIGEEAGKLDRMLVRVAAMLEQRTQRAIERFMAALSPALTVVIAVAVGALVMPVMNTILSINELALR